MPFITQSFLGDKRIQLGVESYTRRFQWGTNWQSIVVGFRCAVNDLAVAAIPSTGLAIGVCVGDEGYYSPYTEYVGQQLGASWEGYSMSTRFDSGQPCFLANACISARKSGVTVTPTGSNGSGAGYTAIVATGILTGMMCQIQKTNSGYYFNLYGSASNVTMDRSDLIKSCEGATTSYGSWAPYANNTVPYDTTHPFNSLCIKWNKFVPTLEIGDIIVTRIY